MRIHKPLTEHPLAFFIGAFLAALTLEQYYNSKQDKETDYLFNIKPEVFDEHAAGEQILAEMLEGPGE